MSPHPPASLSHLHALDCMFSKYSSKLLMIKCRSNCYLKKTMYWMRRIRGYLGNIRKKEAIMVLVGNTLALLLRRWETEKNNLHNFFYYLKKKKLMWCFESLLVLLLVSALMFYMTSLQSNKRKSSPKISSPVEKKLDFNDVDLARHPLSPLRNNSPDSKMHKF